MELLKPLRAICLSVLAVMLVPGVIAQSNSQGSGSSVLQQRYEAAQRFQASHDLDKAAQQYRIFIADALGEIARARSWAGEYDKAADDFDEALKLVPDFPMMQVEYARAALESGNLDRARLLAADVIQKYPANAKAEAGAHAILGRVLLKMDKDIDAKQELERAVELDPTFENGYELAVADLDLGDDQGAAKIFSEMLSSFGDTAAIHMYFGQAYGNSDFQAAAVKEFQEAIGKDDRLAGVHYSLAAAYLATDGSTKLSDAESELKKEIAISPKDAAAYAALGHLLAEQHRNSKDDAEAESDLKRATELDPKSPDVFLYLGQFYSDAKNVPEAETALRKSIALTKDVSRNGYQVQKAHYLLGRLLLQRGQVEEGKAEIDLSQTLMRQALARDQNRLTDYLGEKKATSTDGVTLQMPMSAQDKPKNVVAASEMDAFEKQIAPAIADSYNNLGAIAGSEEEYQTALRYFKRALEWNPTQPGLDYNWGRAAFAGGEFQDAIVPLTRYVKANPEDQGGRTALGLSQYMTKDYADARATLEPLRDTRDLAPQVQTAYADSLVKTGDIDDGVKRLVTLETANPNSAEIHRALGEAYVSEKDRRAADELETTIRLNSNDAEAHAVLGQLQLSKGNAKDAVVNLTAAVELDPGNQTYRQRLDEATRHTNRQ